MSYVKKDQITDVFALSQSFQHNELVVAWRRLAKNLFLNFSNPTKILPVMVFNQDDLSDFYQSHKSTLLSEPWLKQCRQY